MAVQTLSHNSARTICEVERDMARDAIHDVALVPHIKSNNVGIKCGWY
jgi:hypothetical protein